MPILDTIFGSRENKTSLQANVPVVKVAVIGTGSAGKTYLLNAIHRLICGTKMTLKKGLRIGALNAEKSTIMYNQIQANIRLMKKMPLPPTPMRYDFEFMLSHQVKSTLQIVYRDEVGQILTDDDSKRNSLRNEFLKNISEANVVWLLLPMQVDKEGRYTGISHRDIFLAESYLSDALQNRASNSPLAFAILLTKVDVLGDIEREDSKRELHSLHTSLKDRFEWLLECDFISAAALFPISTLGFDNTKLFVGSDSSDSSGSSDEAGIYTLLGDDLKPYNVDKLLLWSLSCACYQHISPPTANSAIKVDDVVTREILNNLQQLDGLVYALKGGY